jgi:hypothetical protein
MPIRLAHETDSVSDFQGGICAAGEPLFGAHLRQIVRLAFNEANGRTMSSSVEEMTSMAGHGRPFWRGALRQTARFFTMGDEIVSCMRRSSRGQV